jgi:hypothetical protein
MNNMLLSLAMAALSQFTGLGNGAPGLGGFNGGGFNGGGFSGGGSSAFPGSGLRPPAYGQPAVPPQVNTLAVVHCLHDAGQIDNTQARNLIAHQGNRRGWGEDWEASISPRKVGQVISRAGGCQRLLSQIGNQGSRIARSRPMPTPAPSSQSEGFGLAPYR